MSNDQGALNKLEHGEFSSALYDIEVSLKNLLGEGSSLAILALKTFSAQFATAFGAQALSVANTAVTSALAGQTVPQIAATVEATLGADAIADAKSAGIDTATVILNAVRVNVPANPMPST
jgi:hypothetical protein